MDERFGPDAVALLRSMVDEIERDLLASPGFEDAAVRAYLDGHPDLVLVP